MVSAGTAGDPDLARNLMAIDDHLGAIREFHLKDPFADQGGIRIDVCINDCLLDEGQGAGGMARKVSGTQGRRSVISAILAVLKARFGRPLSVVIHFDPFRMKQCPGAKRHRVSDRALIVAMLAAGLASGCGIRGPLVLPEPATAKTKTAATVTFPSTLPALPETK